MTRGQDSRSLSVALIQTNSQPTLAPNLEALAAPLQEAAERGADLVVTPENVSLLTFGREAYLDQIAPEEEHPAVHFFSTRARMHGIWLVAGSIAVPVEDGQRIANRQMVFAPDGSVAARYDKIHMFDVDLPGGESYRESAAFRPGADAVIVEGPGGVRLGLSICYDIRFPGLYRTLAKAGADVLLTPAAFTRQTGQAHWHILQRARAIETGCFVLAAAQCGIHHRGRETFGHSLIVGPWGEIVAELGEEPGLIMADLDLGAVVRARAAVPALQHDRPFALSSLMRAAAGA